MFPIPTPGAIGSIETPENEIRILAERSHSYVCPKCKATEKILPPRQCVWNEVALEIYLRKVSFCGSFNQNKETTTQELQKSVVVR
ncbi:hypothetical protein JH06_2516 [Blastocystis sp. subtype 4]|uniref:hypothetical protein n=1 Tax=Blastocystis sp. subtype 4 TaxID=944170 RepID=UPI000712035A|nr:hypothetical protein JH06_2516 [Blastocystis sp. subtype 4]KNB44655.1 hypothetical protein JH06_2516 [Blastocystis sp. subtype 4]|eukprot:XP_014528092.1 hypothetical protein JH06_2516 [Blastocystis sp. subtype 4]